jgi:hypothetical protein
VPGVQVPTELDKLSWFFVTLALISAFSERFADDVMGGVEGKVGKAPQNQVAPTATG